MAVKKTTKKKDGTTPAKEAAPKKAAKPKAAPVQSASPASSPSTADASAAPKKAAAPKKGAAKKAAAPVKLSSSQGELLKKIGAAESGYLLGKKAEQRSIDSLLEKKLIKKGAKDKASGSLRYHISTGGKKHIS